MTIIGMHLSPGGKSALAWCDSEFYRDGVPGGHTQKMAINPLLGVVIVGAGTAYTNEVAAELLRAAFNLEKLLCDLTKDFRKLESGSTTARYTGSCLAIVGWSHALRRIVGFTIDSKSHFAPQPASTFSLPAITDFGFLHPETAEDVVGTTQAQMREIQKIYPSAGAGLLTVAEIRPDAITVRPIYDLGRGEFLRAPLEFRSAA